MQRTVLVRLLSIIGSLCILAVLCVLSTQVLIHTEPSTLTAAHTRVQRVVTYDVNLCDACCSDERELMLVEPPLEGDDVALLQKQLALLGFYSGRITAVFDRPVSEAVAEFQSSQGLAPTGVTDEQTWHALAPSPVPASQQPATAPDGVVSIVVDTRKLTLSVLVDGEEFKKYPCAIGKSSTPTPVGEFMVVNKRREPGGPFGSRWLGLNIPFGTYGIHGTNRPGSIGQMASAGCIRMLNSHVSEIFPWVNVGTRVYILGAEPRAYIGRSLKRGNTGTDVQFLQYRVRQSGFNAGPIDGRFGDELHNAIVEIQKFYGLQVTGIAGPNEFHVLGMK